MKITSLISFLVLFIMLSCRNIDSKWVKNDEVNAVVVGKKIDTDNHYTHVFYLSDGTNGSFDIYMRNDTTLYDFVNIGDSLSANKGEYSLFVHKKDGSVREFKYMDRNGKVYKNKEVK